MEHILETNKNAKLRTKVMDCFVEGEETVVTTIISGEFDGSPIPFNFLFKLKEDRIKSLNIVVA